MILVILRTAFARIHGNLRLVAAAWFLNTILALLVAVPFLNVLDRTVAPTVRDEELVRQFDMNWYRTWQFDNEASPFGRVFDYSTFGAAPFIHHLDGLLSGGTARAVGQTVLTFVTRFRIDTTQLSFLTLLALVYALGSAFLAGGFISAFSLGVRVTLAEFIGDGARYFGRSLRISLIGFVLVYLVVVRLGPWAGDLIGSFTANDASEWGAFVLHLVKNGLLLLLLWGVGLVLDYARVRTVMEDRTGMLQATGAGVAFVFATLWPVAMFSLIMVACVAVLMLLFGVTAAHVSATSYWTIALLFLAQQGYVVLRMFVRALTFAGEVELVREYSEHI